MTVQHKTLPRFLMTRDYDELDRQIMDGNLEPPEFYRASGDVICDLCGESYYKHGQHNPFYWLRVLCSNEVVKL